MTVSAADVAAAVRAVLVEHLPAALATGPRPLPAPTSYNEVPTFEAIRRVKTATLAVSVPRTTEPPVLYADGSYDATWLVSVAVWHEQTPATPLLTSAADYVAKVRQTLLAHPDLGGIGEDLVWTQESIDLIGDEKSAQTLGLGITEFTVRTAAQQTLPTDPTGPTVLDTDVTLTLTRIPS